MADTKNVLSIVATTSDRLSNLSISNGQLVFIQDTSKIAFDFNDVRVIYNQIAEFDEASESGSDGTLYVDSSSQEIYVWDEDAQDYILVANALTEASDEDISALFDGENVDEVSELFEYASDDDIASLFE